MRQSSTIRLLTIVLSLVLFGFGAGEPAHAKKKSKKDKGKEEEKAEWDVNTSDYGPTRVEQWSVEEGTWMHLDVSPDGQTIVFDLVGDIYSLPIDGGTAKLLRGDRSYDLQPRFSPDGSWISFTSDAGGGDNIWVMRADGTDARQVTEESFRLLNNATWTPDGRSLIARKHFTSRRSLGAGEMWLYNVAAGGAGVQLTERPTDQKDVGEPEISPDGRYLYYSLDATPGPVFEYSKDSNDTIYQIRRLDLETGDTETVISIAGGAIRPELSPDGKELAYVRRVRNKSYLIIRDLDSGRDRVVYTDLYRDQQETWAIFGPYPGFAWTPDGESIVIWGKGQLIRVDVAAATGRVIPFKANIKKQLVETLRVKPDFGGETMQVRNLRWPRVSPDGSQVLFQALGYIWIADRDGSNRRRLTRGADFEFYPTWSHDGARIAYTTWNDVDGGHVHVRRADGSGHRVLAERPGHYSEPAFSKDDRWVAYRRGGGDGYRGRLFTADRGIYLVESGGGEPRRVTDSGSTPRFNADGTRLYLMEYGGTKTLYTVNLLGGDRRDIATSERAMEMAPSPDGKWLAFTELWEVYVTPLPSLGGAVAVGPNMSNLPLRKLSTISGEFLDWSHDSVHVRFGLGPDLMEVEIGPLFVHAEETPDAKPNTTRLGWEQPAANPSTDVAFVGATVLTMDGDKVIRDGVVRVKGNKIVAVGKRGEVDTSGAKIYDASGKHLLPGYVDIHAHTGSSNQETHAQSNWAFLANLAYGVTTTHDPSNDTGMIFSSAELVEAGELVGPRVFSTGTILYGAEGDFKALIENEADAKRHLQRLKAYGAFSAKSYNQPRRNQRQWVLKEARALDMNVVPEGGSTFHHNMTMFIDGHTTLEHALPLAPLYEDTMYLVANAGTAYTPTLVVGYGGLWGENYWYQKTDVWKDERLLNFVPRSVVDPISRRRVMVPEEEFYHIELAKVAAEVVKRGGIAEIGAHGQMQGIGVHWELWMFHQGGLSEMDSLRVATILGAKSIGLDHKIGSIEPGKLADLIVLDKDPLANIRNTKEVKWVMVNGRLYEAESMNQLEPQNTKRRQGPNLESVPRSMWDVDCVQGAH